MDQLLEWSPRERGAEQKDAPELFHPCMPVRGAVVGGASDDETAHAVADEAQLVEFDRPGGDQCIEQEGQLPSVVRDVPSGVIAEEDGGDVAVGGQPRAIGHRGLAWETPHRVAAHQAGHEDADVAGRPDDLIGEGLAVKGELGAVTLEGHGNGQARPPFIEQVTEHPVQHARGLIGSVDQRSEGGPRRPRASVPADVTDRLDERIVVRHAIATPVRRARCGRRWGGRRR